MENRAHTSKSYAVEGAISRMDADTEAALSGKQFEDDPSRASIAKEGMLSQYGVQTTILEARAEIGGRCRQTRFQDQLVDLGPNWIHGTETNPIVRLAQQLSVTTQNLEDDPTMFDEDGEPIAAETVEKYSELIWDVIAEAFRLSNAECSTLDPSISLKDYFQEQLPKNGLNLKEQKLVLQMAEMWGSFIGDPWEKQSLKFFWLEECLDGDNLYVPDTHKAIVDKIAAPVVSADNTNITLHLSSPVERIHCDESGSLLVDGPNFSGGFTDIILTVPLGCLKANTPAIIPQLPIPLQRAIAQTSFSTLEKVWIAFPHAFWEETPTQQSEDSDKVNPQDDSVSPKQSSPTWSSFTHFLTPQYTGQQAWTLEMQALPAERTLLFSLYGDCASHVLSLQGDIALLDAFFRPHYALLPGYDEHSPDCVPAAITSTSWADDEYCRGSYTNFQVYNGKGKQLQEGQEEDGTEEMETMPLDEALLVMRRGVPERGIWLAGEHCAPFVATGTLTGAFWSGEIAAKRLLRSYGLINDFAEVTE